MEVVFLVGGGRLALLLALRVHRRQALAQTRTEPFTVVTGSLYFIGSALQALGQGGVGGVSELALNEYTRAA